MCGHLTPKERMLRALRGETPDVLPAAPGYPSLFLADFKRAYYIEQYRLRMRGRDRYSVNHQEDTHFRAQALYQSYGVFKARPDWIEVGQGATRAWAERTHIVAQSGVLHYEDQLSGERKAMHEVLVPYGNKDLYPDSSATTDKWDSPDKIESKEQVDALNHRDLGMFDWEPDGTFILGADGAGIVEALGPGVTAPAVGTEVLINPAVNWGVNTSSPDIENDERAVDFGAKPPKTIRGDQDKPMPKNNDHHTMSNNTSPYPSGFRLLTDAQLAEIHLASLEILRRTGVRVHEPEALELLQDAGCIVTAGDLVRFPAAVVEDALQHAPSRVALCDRTGEPCVLLEGHRTYFGTGSDLPNTLDLETGERRPSLLSDVEQTARLADALPNLDFIMSMALPSDVPIETSDRRSFLAMIQNTVKPVVFTAWNRTGLADIIAMAEAVAGGGDELALKPFLFAYLEPSSPLQHSKDALQKMLMMADHRLPFVYAPGPIEGASAPVTSAGSLVMANAEVLSGLAIAQLRRPGTPFVWGSGSGPLDMRTMVGTYSAPEFMLHCMAMAELAHFYYNLPVWGFSGCSDSKLPDIQAGIESALWILWTALSGANLVHDVGYVESGLTCSYEMIVMGDEIISFVRRLMGGIPFTPETLALNLIHQVGPGGDYLGTRHTASHFRGAWYPRVLDRRAYHGWMQAGKPTAIETARAVARETLATHQPLPLAGDTLETLQAIIDEADARAGIGERR